MDWFSVVFPFVCLVAITWVTLIIVFREMIKDVLYRAIQDGAKVAVSSWLDRQRGMVFRRVVIDPTEETLLQTFSDDDDETS